LGTDSRTPQGGTATTTAEGKVQQQQQQQQQALLSQQQQQQQCKTESSKQSCAPHPLHGSTLWKHNAVRT
jgi:hypothetical protein